MGAFLSNKSQDLSLDRIETHNSISSCAGYVTGDYRFDVKSAWQPFLAIDEIVNNFFTMVGRALVLAYFIANCVQRDWA